jgi:hypothetical protein
VSARTAARRPRAILANVQTLVAFLVAIASFGLYLTAMRPSVDL